MAKRSNDTTVLGPEHFDAITSAEQIGAMLPAVISKCEQCDIDMAAHKEALQAALAKLATFKKVWFPKGRPK